MPKLKKHSPATKTLSLKERISLLENSLAETQKLIATLPNMNSNQSILDSLEQANGETKSVLPSLESMEVASGQLAETSLEKVKRLEEALGTAKTNPFGTTDFEIFEQNLDGMTMASLQSLAERVGVSPHTSLPELKKNLKTAFVHSTKGNLRERPIPKNTSLDPRNPKHLKVMQLLGMKAA